MRNPTVGVFLCGLLLLSPATLLAQDSGSPEALHKRVEWLVERARTEQHLDAVALAATVGENQVLAGGWGTLGRGSATEASLFPGGGMSEFLLAVACLRVAHQGKVDLQAPLAALLPERRLPWPELSLHTLLGHTSGLPNVNMAQAKALPASSPEVGTKPEEPWLAWLRGSTPLSAANSCLNWSNADLLLANLWLQDASGLNLLEYSSSELFPLLEGNATRYSPARRQEWSQLDAWMPSSDLAGPVPLEFGTDRLQLSALDLLALQRSLDQHSLLGKQAVLELLGDVRLSNGTSTGYGYATQRTRLERFEGYCYGGSANGGTVRVTRYPELDLTIGLLAVGEAQSLAALERSIARAILDLQQQELVDLPLERDEFVKYLGTYQIGCSTLTIAAADQHLELRAPDETHVLLNQGGGLFADRGQDEFTLHFRFDSNGKAHEFTLTEHGAESIAKRFE